MIANSDGCAALSLVSITQSYYMRASVSQFFEEVSEAYDSLDLHEMERRTSVIEEAAPTVTDP